MAEGGNPVLLVHGFATSARRTWFETGWTDLLADAGREVIAPDLLGHGEADKPHDVAAYAGVEDAIAAVLPTDRPVDAVGYSAGARVVLALAAQQPDRFGRIVIGGLGGRLFERRDGNPVLDAVEGRTGDDDVVGAHFRAMANADDNDPRALAAFLQREQPRIDRSDLAVVTNPVLVVIGDADFAGPGEPLADALPNGEVLTLRGVDHFGLPKAFPFLEKGLEFIGAGLG